MKSKPPNSLEYLQQGYTERCLWHFGTWSVTPKWEYIGFLKPSLDHLRISRAPGKSN